MRFQPLVAARRFGSQDWGGELFLGAMGVAVVSTIGESIDHRRRE